MVGTKCWLFNFTNYNSNQGEGNTKNLLAAGAFVLATVMATIPAVAQEKPFTINGDGNLVRPTDYRSWVYVGTPVTPNDLNDGAAAFPEFHAVYIDPESYRIYKETGKFRENTILIKELVSVGSKQAVSDAGYFMGDFIGLEATIKSAEHFPDEPGNWAYFSFTNKEGPLKGVTNAFDTGSCNACHEGAAADDFVFTQYYPVLRAAKGFGKGTPEN